MDVTVDLGNNITGMFATLAAQIGVTVDKVFPWYVQQAYLQGLTNMVAIVLALVLFGTVFAISIRKANFDEGNAAAPISFIAGVALVFALGAAFIAGPQCVRKMVNPQFYAMTMITEDLGRLARK